MSHHFDYTADERLDISDAYCFAGASDARGTRTVFGMNASPSVGTPWDPAGYYELKLDTNEDYVEDITWRIDEADRWVVIGPNGAGKTTLLQVLAAQIHPTYGVAGLLGEVLGTVDVFELRPRIGLTSAAIAERLPRGERVHDVVVSASYAVLGRWREEYDRLDHERAG